MPFLGQDWRSTGVVWQRTARGWQDVIVLNNRQHENENVGIEGNNGNLSNDVANNNNEQGEEDRRDFRVMLAHVRPEERRRSPTAQQPAHVQEKARYLRVQEINGNLLEFPVGSSDAGNLNAKRWIRLYNQQTRYICLLEEGYIVPQMRATVGHGHMRHATVSLSEALDSLDLLNRSTVLRCRLYCTHFFAILLTRMFNKLSGTLQIQIFSTLEQMVNEATTSETGIEECKLLLDITWQQLQTHSSVGSKSLRRKNKDCISNLRKNLDQFSYQMREHDEKPTLLDLPKECLYQILYSLTDHKDVLNVGSTCSYLRQLTEEEFLWRKLTSFNFTEKQISNNFPNDDSSWYHVYQCCFRKVKKLRAVYCDQLHVCGKCRTVFWAGVGHICPNAEEFPHSIALSPMEFLVLFDSSISATVEKLFFQKYRLDF